MLNKIKNNLVSLAPVLGLGILIILFLVIGLWKDINIAYGLKAVINQSVVVGVVATGAVFIYTLGSFDISLGASTAVSALLGGFVYLRTSSLPLMFLTCISTAVLIGLIDSLLASVFNLPVFVTTIAMLSILNALVLLLIGMNQTGSEIAVPSEAVKSLDTVWLKVLVLCLYFAFCLFFFNYTPVGRKEKILGGNARCARLTGISLKKYSIIAFLISGLGIGLGAFLTITYSPTLTRNTASSIGMDVIIAIVFGGMPVSGGAKSKIYSALIGAFSMTFLSQIMTLLNLNSGIGQMVKAVIFLFVVFVASGKSGSRMLTR